MAEELKINVRTNEPVPGSRSSGWDYVALTDAEKAKFDLVAKETIEALAKVTGQSAKELADQIVFDAVKRAPVDSSGKITDESKVIFMLTGSGGNGTYQPSMSELSTDNIYDFEAKSKAVFSTYRDGMNATNIEIVAEGEKGLEDIERMSGEFKDKAEAAINGKRAAKVDERADLKALLSQISAPSGESAEAAKKPTEVVASVTQSQISTRTA